MTWTRRCYWPIAVLVLRGGRIAEALPLGLPRPRRHADPALAPLRARLLAALGVSEAVAAA